MALNPYFQQGATSEQNLVQDLINEQLRMYGVEVYYLPRQYVTKNTVIKEVIESKFTNAYPLEAYVDTYDGYEGVGTLLSKFGVQELDDLVLLRSDGSPTYHLCNVVDDFSQGITTVVRGEDHLSNTPRQIHIQQAFCQSQWICINNHFKHMVNN